MYVGNAQVLRGLIQLAENRLQLIFLDRRAMLAHALLVGCAPALDGAGDDRQRAIAVLDDVQFAERFVDLRRIMAVDDPNDKAVGLHFSAIP